MDAKDIRSELRVLNSRIEEALQRSERQQAVVINLKNKRELLIESIKSSAET